MVAKRMRWTLILVGLSITAGLLGGCAKKQTGLNERMQKMDPATQAAYRDKRGF